jgi:hypothetical protein
MFHKWQSLDGYDGANVDRCYQCGVICAYPKDSPKDPNRSWLIRIGDLRSLIPACEWGTSTPRNAHRWAVTGKDPFPSRPESDPNNPDAFCDRGTCVMCEAKIDLNTAPGNVSAECPVVAIDIV